MADELKVIREYVQDVPIIKHKVIKLEEDMSVLKSDMKIVKVAITDMSHQLIDHERRITRLEIA